MGEKKAVLRLMQGGRVLEAGSGFDDFKVFDLEGLSGLEFDFDMTKNPGSPNAVVSSKKPLPREIEMKIHAVGELRQFLNGFFNPYERGTLVVTWGDISRWINYYAHPVKIVQNTVYRRIEANVKLICPEPYWKDMDDFGKNIATRQKLLSFPFVMRPVTGVVADYRIFNTKVPILNRGDVEVGARIVFRAIGSVKNPRLTLNDIEFVKVITDMVKGDEIEIRTTIDDLSVTKNGEDFLNRSDPKMSFFQIPKGENVIEFGADEGTANLDVFVYYTPLYIGI